MMRTHFYLAMMAVFLAAGWTVCSSDDPAKASPQRDRTPKGEPRKTGPGKDDPGTPDSGKVGAEKAGPKTGRPALVPLITFTMQDVDVTSGDAAAAGQGKAASHARSWSSGKTDEPENPALKPKPKFVGYPGFDPDRPPRQPPFYYWTDSRGMQWMTEVSFREYKQWKAEMDQWTETKKAYDESEKAWRDEQHEDLRKQGVSPGRIRQMEKDGRIDK